MNPAQPPPNSAPSLEWAALSDQGLRRKNNEDSWGAWTPGAGEGLPAARAPLPEQGVVLAVSDGMGGAAAGEVASQYCIDQLRRELAPAAAATAASALAEAFGRVHQGLLALAEAKPELQGMGATLSALWLRPGGDAALVHIGDSRIYQGVSGQPWVQLTEDHSVGAAMVRRGEMSAEAARRLRFRSMLEQVMGGDGAPIEPQVLGFRWAEGMRFVLCSDGLHGPLEADLEVRMDAALAGGVTAAAAALVAAANDAGGPDNVTVVLAHFVPGQVA